MEEYSEVWLSVPGYEGYYSVSNLGRVRRDAAATGAKVGRILTPKNAGKGYRMVALSRHSKKTNYYVHRLVAICFMGLNATSGLEVNHENGDKTDNRACNLSLVTHNENVAHAIDNGYRGTGKLQTGRPTKKVTRKLSDQQVREICESAVSAFLTAQLYGISRSYVSSLRNGRHRNYGR